MVKTLSYFSFILAFFLLVNDVFGMRNLISFNCFKGNCPDNENTKDNQFLPGLNDDMRRKIIGLLDTRDMANVGLVSKSGRNFVEEFLPSLKHNKGVRKHCDETSSYLFLKQIYEKDYRRRVRIDRLSENCLKSVSQICKLMPDSLLEISIESFQVKRTRKLSNLIHCNLDLHAIFSDIPTLLDVSLKTKDFKLVKLAIEFKQMKFGNRMAKLISILLQRSQNNVLTHLILPGNRIGNVGINYIAKALEYSPGNRLEVLDIRDNLVEDAGIEALSKAMKSPNCHLKNVTLKSNEFGLDGMRALVSALTHQNNQLVHLDLSYNVEIKNEGVRMLGEALTYPNCKLESLHLDSINFGYDGMDGLAEGLNHRNNRLTSLSVKGNGLVPGSLRPILFAISNPNNKLRKLDVSDNTLGHIAGLELSNMLSSRNCKLEYLKVSGTFIHDIGAQFLMKGVRRSPLKKIKHLDLSNNSIDKIGFIEMAKSIARRNNQIEILNLSNTGATDKSMKILAKGLKSKHSKVKELYLSVNNLRSAGLKTLESILTSPHNTITKITLANNDITDIAAETIANILKSEYNKLTYLDISSNNLEKHGLGIVFKALDSPNCKLKYLKLSGNKIDKSTKKLAMRIYKRKFKTLNLN